ncbi:MAG: DinB family protein [Dehalococcoidia bacterium]
MSILPHLYRHNRWANLTLLDFCIPLNREQLSAQAPATAYGAYGCLVHLLLNEEGYYQTTTDEKLDVPEFDWNRLPRLADLRARFEAIADRYIALADQLAEDRIIEGEWQGQPYSMPAYVPFFQCINHSTEHREQAKAGLAVAGLQPPTIDVWAWQDAGRP